MHKFLQQLVVGMADSGGDEMVVYAPPPSYKFMKHDDKVSPLVLANIFSPIDLEIGISRFAIGVRS
jgi:hypothetical protein